MLNKDCRIFIPLYNVNLFTAEFIHYSIDTCPIHTYAGTYCVDIRVSAIHCDLGTGTGFTGYTLNLHNTALDLCNFCLKQTFYEFRMRTADHNSWSSRCVFYFRNINTNLFMRTETFCFYLFLFCQNRIDFSNIYRVISIGITLNRSCNNIFFFCIILIIQNFSFFFANFLYNNLFCLLRGNTSEVLWRYFDAYGRSQICHTMSRFCFCQSDLKCIIKNFLDNNLILVYMKFSCCLI